MSGGISVDDENQVLNVNTGELGEWGGKSEELSAETFVGCMGFKVHVTHPQTAMGAVLLRSGDACSDARRPS